MDRINTPFLDIYSDEVGIALELFLFKDSVS